MTQPIHIEMKRYDGSIYTITCPKTVVEQVVNWNHHELHNSHISDEVRQSLLTLATINENGYVNTKGKVRTVVEYPTFDELMSNIDNHPSDTMAIVIDATDDITVDSGWAMYIIHKDAHGAIPYKISDNLMFDVGISLATIKGFNQTYETIDTLVSDSHIHTNLSILDRFDGENVVMLDTLQQVYTEEANNLDSLAAKSNDMIFVKTEK